MLGTFGFNWWTGRKSAANAGGTSATFHLWIDGVGGYLVCPGSYVTLGQATPRASVDIPLQADVSRLHVTFARDAEGYMLRAVKPTKVNDKPATEALLRDGDMIAIGPACRLQFRQPVPISASARLELASGHRPRISVDGVLLMADTLLLANSEQAHVQIPDLGLPVVLFREGNGMGIRAAGATVNGKAFRDRGPLRLGDRVEGEGFAFSLEAV